MNNINDDLQEIKLKVNLLRDKTLKSTLIEVLCIAFLLSLSSGFILLGLTGLFWPCEGNICRQNELAGAYSMLAGVILLFSSAIIALVNFKN